MKMTIVVAARGRSELLAKTLETTLGNVRSRDTTMLIALDSDDTQTIEAVGKLASERVLVNIHEREDTIAEKYNRALVEAPADLYLTHQDSAPHITPGFDERFMKAASLFPDGIGVVYDHFPCLSFPGAQAMTAGLVKKLGWIYPPYFPYWFVDHWIDDIARLIDRIAFANCQQHFTSHVTQERRELAFWAHYFDLCGLKRRDQARAIIDGEDFLEPDWRKALLRNHHPMIEYRSVWINNEVRRMNLPEPKEPGGERYDRVKQRALKMIQDMMPKLEAEQRAMQEEIDNVR